jgi:competence protein ComEA
MDLHPDPDRTPLAEREPVARLRAWLRPTPVEVVGLCALLAGALAVAVVLWVQAERRPSTVPSVSGVGREVHAADDPHDGSWHEAGYEDDGDPVGTAAGHADPGAGAGDAPPPAAAVELIVHVSGAVRSPGLVTLPGGARVGDALEAAGGAEDDAELAALNLARPLEDGEQVHVLRVGEEPPAWWTGAAGSGAAPAVAGPAPDAAGPPTGGARLADGRLDLNRATTDELETLPGIGPAKAAAIVRHREEHGPFRQPGDLRAVSGIGEKTFQNLADLVATP